jgi:hypothetical protein
MIAGGWFVLWATMGNRQLALMTARSTTQSSTCLAPQGVMLIGRTGLLGLTVFNPL